MKVWAFDENRADFVDAAPERMNADATGYYIIRRGDDVLVREHGQERPMPERLTVAGVPFDREQFEHTHPLPLRGRFRIRKLKHVKRSDTQQLRGFAQAANP